MVSVRVLVEPVERQDISFGSYQFEILPRAGERLMLDLRRGREVFRVERVEHRLVNSAAPPDVVLVVTQLDGLQT